MKTTTRYIIFLTASLILCCIPCKAQNKSGGVCLSLWKNIATQPSDTTQTTYLNLGIVSSLHQLKGIGLNVFGSFASNSVYGIQVSGLSNIAGGSMKGIQLSGLTNINGDEAAGFIGSGIANVTGNNLHGIGVSGLMNITGNNVKALLVSGMMNITGTTTTGVSIAGILNIEGGGTSKGIKMGGIGNIIGSNLSGVAVGGLMNISGNNTNGIQIASLTNISGGQTSGIQLSGLANISVHAKGLQIAGLGNVAQSLHGAQIGIYNRADFATNGVQIGIVNKSKSSAAAKFGLVNVNPDTRYQLMVYGGNTTKTNVAMRFKNKLFYTILGLGSHYFDFDKKISASAFYRTGLGFDIAKNLFLSGDLGYQHIETFHNKYEENIPARIYALQARINLEYHLTEKFGVFASGGYDVTRYYSKNKTFEDKPIVELGIVLF